MSAYPRLCFFLLLLGFAAPAAAQNNDVPYWASIRAEEVNMRVGPGETYRIEWVYKRPELPLKVLRKKEGWRLVEDPDGAKGWLVGRFLTLDRTAIVAGKDLAEMREQPGGSRVAWRVEPGVVGKLGDCDAGWCGFAVGARKGFVRRERLWGAGEP